MTGESTPIHPLNPDGSSERLIWLRFLDAADEESYHQAWIELLSCRLASVTRAFVARRCAPENAFQETARFPVDAELDGAMYACLERIETEGRRLALELDGRHYIGQPIGPDLTVAVELGGRGAEDPEQSLWELAWGTGWLDRAGPTRHEPLEGASSVLIAAARLTDYDSFEPAAVAFVNDLAKDFACERVSIGFRRGSSVRVEAISGVQSLRHRSGAVAAVEAAMTEALDQRSIVHWPAPDSSPRQVLRRHVALAALSGDRSICSIPASRGHEFCAVVTLERATVDRFEPDEIRRADALLGLSLPGLEGLRRERHWPREIALGSLSRTATALLGPRGLPGKLIALAIFLLLLGSIIIKGDHRVTAECQLEAEVMRAAVAPFDGYVASAPRRAGDRVEERGVLAEMERRDLGLELTKWDSEVRRLERAHAKALAGEDPAQIPIVQAQIDQARSQGDLFRERMRQATIRAPISGWVVSGDLTQRLGAPISQGEVLFEVAPLDAYRLALRTDERDVASVKEGQRGMVTFAALPSDKMPFTVDRVTPISESGEGSNLFRVEGRLDVEHPDLRPGLEGVAKVLIDRKPWLWIWSHDVLDWLRLTAWRWWP